MRRTYYTPYVQPRKPLISTRVYCILLAVELVVLAVMVGSLIHDIQNDRNLYSGVVIEKIGQNTPIITWPAQYYEGWRSGNEIPDPEGWFVLVQNGNSFQRFRLTQQQFDRIEVNAHIWRFGPWTWWRNS